jgi:hypothetical protein
VVAVVVYIRMVRVDAVVVHVVIVRIVVMPLLVVRVGVLPVIVVFVRRLLVPGRDMLRVARVRIVRVNGSSVCVLHVLKVDGVGMRFVWVIRGCFLPWVLRFVVSVLDGRRRRRGSRNGLLRGNGRCRRRRG